MNEAYAQAIKDIESSGGDYGALGPVTGSGDRAYGAYQVMGKNIPDWTEQHYGQRLSPDEFVKNKEAQDAVFHGQFGSYIGKYGNPQDAASAWFTGRPIAQNNNDSDGSTTANQYVDKFNAGLSKYGDGSGVSAINSAAGIKPRSAGPALGFTNEDDEEDTPTDPKDATGALSTDNTVGPGALSGRILKGDGGATGHHKFAQGLMQLAAALSAGNPGQANALNAQLTGMRNDSQGKYKIAIGKDGRIVRVDSDGNVDVVGGSPGGVAHSYQQAHGKDANGNPIYGTYDRASGQYSWPKQSAAASAPQPTTPEELASIDPGRAAAAKAVFEGRAALPTGSRFNPQQQQLRNDVFAVYPGVDQNIFAARKRFQEGKAGAQPSSFGGLMQRGEIATDVLDKTLDSYGQLGNTDSMLGQNISAAENYLKSGGTQKGKVFNELATNAKNAATDINAIQNGGRGSAGEREEIENKLNLPYASHVVQSGAVQAHINALKSALETRFAQEKAQLGEDYLNSDPDYVRLKGKIDNLQAKADKLYKGDFTYAPKIGVSGPAANSAAPASGLPSGWSVTVK